MAHPDYSDMFSCPKCGTMGAIYVLKHVGAQIIVKQRCPTHGGRSYKIPSMQIDFLSPYIRSAIFLCFKCGQNATVDIQKKSGPWTLIRCVCPTHGNKLPFQKIWSTVYDEVFSTQPAETPTVIQHQEYTPNIALENCPFCDSVLEESSKFCSNCGQSLNIKEEKHGFKICSNCGTSQSSEAQFCSECGLNL